MLAATCPASLVVVVETVELLELLLLLVELVELLEPQLVALRGQMLRTTRAARPCPRAVCNKAAERQNDATPVVQRCCTVAVRTIRRYTQGWAKLNQPNPSSSPGGVARSMQCSAPPPKSISTTGAVLLPGAVLLSCCTMLWL